MLEVGNKPKLGQVDEQAEYLEKTIAELSQALGELESRLERVLQPLTPTTEEKGKVAEINLVPFADFLRTRAWAVGGIRNRINSILERLEL